MESSSRGFDLRCVLIDDQPWFAAQDVCAALGYKNQANFTSKLSSSEIRRLHIAEGRARPNNMISERGFYEVITRAQKKNPKAREFQDWVFGAVLPAIRKVERLRALRDDLSATEVERLFGDAQRLLHGLVSCLQSCVLTAVNAVTYPAQRMSKNAVLVPLVNASRHQAVFHVVPQRVNHMARVLGECAQVLHESLRDRVRASFAGILGEQQV